LNLRRLLTSRKLSLRNLADQVGGDTEELRDAYYRWLRRAASQGLTRCEDRNRDQLERIGNFFGVHPVERLWSSALAGTHGVADELAEMLRFIIQTTTPLDGTSREFSDVVDADSLMSQIRNAYELLLADRRISGSKEIRRVTPEILPESEATTRSDDSLSVDPPNDGESREDYFLRLSLRNIQNIHETNPESGWTQMLRRLGLELLSIIRDSIRDEPDESLSFKDVFERHIKPNIIRACQSLEEDDDDDN